MFKLKKLNSARNQARLKAYFPAYASDCLLTNKPVPVKPFFPVTIFYSDIAGFTELSGKHEPKGVYRVLDQLYKVMDTCILECEGLLKVETIGDAMEVVAGVPAENQSNNHAESIAKFALLVQKSLERNPIKDDFGQPIVLRMGIHTGAVCAGIVGRTMPRYAIYGYDQSIANKLESHAPHGKILCSRDTYTYFKRKNTTTNNNNNKLLHFESYKPSDKNAVIGADILVATTEYSKELDKIVDKISNSISNVVASTRVLLVCDEYDFRIDFCKKFENYLPWHIQVAGDSEEAIAIYNQGIIFDVIIVHFDIDMGHDIGEDSRYKSGFQLLEYFYNECPTIPLIAIEKTTNTLVDPKVVKRKYRKRVIKSSAYFEWNSITLGKDVDGLNDLVQHYIYDRKVKHPLLPRSSSSVNTKLANNNNNNSSGRTSNFDSSGFDDASFHSSMKYGSEDNSDGNSINNSSLHDSSNNNSSFNTGNNSENDGSSNNIKKIRRYKSDYVQKSSLMVFGNNNNNNNNNNENNVSLINDVRMSFDDLAKCDVEKMISEEDPDIVLFKMFPKKVAWALLKNEPIVPYQPPHDVTVMFVAVSQYNEICAPQHLHKIYPFLNKVYCIMDYYLRLYPSLYKVETIKNTYMVATDLDYTRESALIDMLDYASLIQDKVKQLMVSPLDNKTPIELTIGIHKGPVISGMMGCLKQRLVLVGDTTNVASRMCSNSKPSEILVTQAVVQTLKRFEQSNQRYKKTEVIMKIKGKGMMKVCWIKQMLDKKRSSRVNNNNNDYSNSNKLRDKDHDEILQQLKEAENPTYFNELLPPPSSALPVPTISTPTMKKSASKRSVSDLAAMELDSPRKTRSSTRNSNTTRTIANNNNNNNSNIDDTHDAMDVVKHASYDEEDNIMQPLSKVVTFIEPPLISLPSIGTNNNNDANNNDIDNSNNNNVDFGCGIVIDDNNYYYEQQGDNNNHSPRQERLYSDGSTATTTGSSKLSDLSDPNSNKFNILVIENSNVRSKYLREILSSDIVTNKTQKHEYDVFDSKWNVFYLYSMDTGLKILQNHSYQVHYVILGVHEDNENPYLHFQPQFLQICNQRNIPFKAIIFSGAPIHVLNQIQEKHMIKLQSSDGFTKNKDVVFKLVDDQFLKYTESIKNNNSNSNSNSNNSYNSDNNNQKSK